MLAPFEYHSPESLEETTALLSQKKTDMKILAGGTDLVNGIRRRVLSPSSLVSLKKVSSLRYLSLDRGHRELRVGSMTTLTELATSPLIIQNVPILAEAAGQVGSVQIRNRGTIGGNICNASPAADTIPPLLVLQGKVKILAPGGTRVVPMEELFLAPGKTVLRADEIVTEIQIPLPPEGSKGAYIKQGIRKAMDIAIIGVAVLLVFTPSKRDVCRDVRIALGSVAPTPIRAFHAEQRMKGKSLRDDVIRETAREAGNEIRPISDIRASAEYRKELVVVLTERVIREAMQNGSPIP